METRHMLLFKIWDKSSLNGNVTEIKQQIVKIRENPTINKQINNSNLVQDEIL